MQSALARRRQSSYPGRPVISQMTNRNSTDVTRQEEMQMLGALGTAWNTVYIEEMSSCSSAKHCSNECGH